MPARFQIVRERRNSGGTLPSRRSCRVIRRFCLQEASEKGLQITKGFYSGTFGLCKIALATTGKSFTLPSQQLSIGKIWHHCSFFHGTPQIRFSGKSQRESLFRTPVFDCALTYICALMRPATAQAAAFRARRAMPPAHLSAAESLGKQWKRTSNEEVTVSYSPATRAPYCAPFLNTSSA